MAIVRETLARLLPPGSARWVGLALIAGSYGITGVFFGHVEHYAIMSLGTFLYVHYGVRYVQGDSGMAAPALALSLLLTTHLMAAWLVPSLVLLPWLRGGARAGFGRELGQAILWLGIPNLAVWIVVVLTYYEGSVANLFGELMTGDFSHRTVRGGNSLGGANNEWFLTPATILSWYHVRRTLLLLFLYSPFVFVACPILLVSAPRAAFRRVRESAPARLLLALLVPYLIFMLTWEADLGYTADWDLFSHVTIFAVLLGLVLAPSVPGASWRRFVVLGSLGLSLVTTAALVLETHRAETPTGVARVFHLLGDEIEEPGKPRQTPPEHRRGGRRR